VSNGDGPTGRSGGDGTPTGSRFGAGDVAFFDAVAPLYDRAMVPVPTAELRVALGRADRPVDRVLDLAGGSGRATAGLSDAEVVVCDVSKGMLRAAPAEAARVRGDARRLPLADGVVDAVVVVDALHHVPDPERALGEAARVLAPGGVVVVREFDPTTLPGRAIELAEALAGMGSTFLAPPALRAALEAAGLRAGVLFEGWDYTVTGVKPGWASDRPAAGDEPTSQREPAPQEGA